MTNLKALRLRARLTTDELGKHADVSGATIRNLEGGRSDGRVETLGKLADFFTARFAEDIQPAFLLLEFSVPPSSTPSEEAAA